MKRFVGGSDGQVAVLDESGVRWLGRYEWGDQGPSCATLAKIILGTVLGDDVRTTRLYRRFMHRTVAGFAKGKPWSSTDAEVLTVIDDIERVEKETARDVQRMMREPMRGAVNMGIPDTAQWGGTHNQSNQPPEITVNDPRKAK